MATYKFLMILFLWISIFVSNISSNIYISSSNVQTPAGVYCPGEKNKTTPLPIPTTAFHFRAEIVVPGVQSVDYIEVKLRPCYFFFFNSFFSNV